MAARTTRGLRKTWRAVRFLTPDFVRLQSRLPLALLVVTTLVLIWSGIRPFDYTTWILEVAPVLVGIPLLLITRRRFSFTPLLYTLMAAHACLLAVGGHYTYSLVPAGDWFRDWLHLSRNHYDRLSHIAQGLVPAMIARELIIRLHVVSSPAWRNFFIISICMAISATYEIIEWATALVLGEVSDSFLGTQGDPWDTQMDMFLALVGAVAALTLLGKWHDSQMRCL
jgi:putative membrane protein